MAGPTLVLKIDVDTERGTRVGVPALMRLFDSWRIPATFLFSLGPDHTGRAIRRVFRPGFFRKVSRTSVLSTYGVRTLLNGVLLPGPHIGKRHEGLMRAVASAGHEVGIHCYDHIRWQDGLATMSGDEVRTELGRARAEFDRIFGRPARVAGAAGWQANAESLAAYDEAGFTHASDTRGVGPFRPAVRGRVFRVGQWSTTLPTLDELLGRADYPLSGLTQRYVDWALAGAGVWTLHAELEGMRYLDWFTAVLKALHGRVHFVTLEEAMARTGALPVCELVQGTVPGRAGTLAIQGPAHPVA